MGGESSKKLKTKIHSYKTKQTQVFTINHNQHARIYWRTYSDGWFICNYICNFDLLH